MLKDVKERIEELMIEYYEVGADYDGFDSDDWIEIKLNEEGYFKEENKKYWR